jgi:hypothetical protein
MKNIKGFFYIAVCSLLVPFRGTSQQQNATFKSLLSEYYQVKDALVSGNPKNAAKAASALAVSIQSLDTKNMSAADLKTFQSIQPKIAANAKMVSANDDLAKQRTAFQSLSDNVIALRRAVHISTPSYVQYCPMKKAQWLSTEATIKNPYYGSSMLTCGEVKEVIED